MESGQAPDESGGGGSEILELAQRAIHELRKVDGQADPADTYRHLAAVSELLDQMARRLRVGRNARTVMLDLLRDAYPGEVSSEVLRYASGIQTFTRRLRELREEGFRIEFTGTGYRLDQRPVDPSETHHHP